MKKFLSFLLLLCIALPAYAEEDKTIRIEVNKGQMLRLPRAASSVIVADPSTADIQVVSPKSIYIHAKKIGETSLVALTSNDDTIMDVTVEVTHNISKLNRALKELMPDADVKFRTVDGGMVLGGFVDTPMESETIKTLASSFVGEKEKIVNMITTSGTDQITLMVKVVEVSRNELKRFGINLAAILNTGNFAFQLLQGRDILTSAVTGAVTRPSGDNAILGGWNANGKSVNGVIDALENQGLVSVLAEPSLTTTSGKTANFLAGGEFPIPIVDGDGKVSVEYKPFGISLNFTPTVLSKDKISLAVTPEVSNISSIDGLSLGTTTSFVIPSIQTRRAQTTVELGSGQTFAIAGLFRNDRNNTVEKFPGLGDIPVLGALFRSHEFQNDQSELVILVTPYMVRPISEAKKVATPLDGYTPPTDLQRLLMGKLYQEGEAPTPEDMPTLHGDGGFILE